MHFIAFNFYYWFSYTLWKASHSKIKNW